MQGIKSYLMGIKLNTKCYNFYTHHTDFQYDTMNWHINYFEKSTPQQKKLQRLGSQKKHINVI